MIMKNTAHMNYFIPQCCLLINMENASDTTWHNRIMETKLLGAQGQSVPLPPHLTLRVNVDII